MPRNSSKQNSEIKYIYVCSLFYTVRKKRKNSAINTSGLSNTSKAKIDVFEEINPVDFRAQSFTSLKADLRQDINGGFAFSRCLNGTFP